ncbi:Thioredoxin superfamily protein isoform 1 [Theobroma cacao]|uniref:Glutaredoxin-like protein n=1 Tax=Theobroma cacao TaxID=3641 RepID=A0A061FHU9_THECC|nr:Thioredoxin superfamily protein isoform 1 [Theobroma cacao]EOY16248.1 Thioredoxin superfamily protein isoform 1 [Theobroma cacao]
MLSKGVGTMATTATMAARSLSIAHNPRHKLKWVFTPLSFCSSATRARKLVLYSKPGCCLCDGLKEKLRAAFSISGPDSLHDITLQVRDITSNPEWEEAYQYEIPVLAKVLPDGTEEILPRLSPRLGVELVQKKIAAAFRHRGISMHQKGKENDKDGTRDEDFKPPAAVAGD